MPKEIVGRTPNEDGLIEASWGRDLASVQLAVKGPPNWRDNLDGVDIGIEADRYAFPEHILDWHLQLTHRAEVNDLIRVLRKARDQAFGRDE